MQLVNNTGRLIEHTQQLIGQCLESGNYGEAIAFSGLLKDLSESYKSLASVNPPAPQIQIQRSPGKLVGALAFDKSPLQQAVEKFPPSGFGVVRSQYQEPKLAQPTQYKWPDGFSGVTLPPTEEQGDYWAE